MLMGNNFDLVVLYGSPDDNLNNEVTRHLPMSVVKLLFCYIYEDFWDLILVCCARNTEHYPVRNRILATFNNKKNEQH